MVEAIGPGTVRGVYTRTRRGAGREAPGGHRGGQDTPLGYMVGAMKDLVCGMEVQPETASAAWEHAGEVYYFCSARCMEAFRLDPDRYLSMDGSDRRM